MGNFYRDDLRNMRYLPRFKWHQLKETAIYNRQVRKARLEQKVSQARRENEFYLERVHQAKVQRKIAEKRSAKGIVLERNEIDTLHEGQRRGSNSKTSLYENDGSIGDIS